MHEPADLVGGFENPHRSLAQTTGVTDQTSLGGQQRHEPLKVAARRGGEEPLGQLAPFGRVDVVAGPPLVDVLTCPSGELTHRGLRTVEHAGDLGVRVSEYLAEHEHRALRRREGLQDDEDGERDGVGEHGPLGSVRNGVHVVRDIGLGQPGTGVRLVARPHLTQTVDGEPGGDTDQVPARFALVRSAPDQRGHASRTTSSASATRPSMR